MSFLTSFMFFFSTGCPERSEANFSVAIGWSFSPRAFGVLAGALFVRRLAILVSFLSSLAHLSALRRHAFQLADLDRKSTRLNSSHLGISYAVFCLKKKQHEALEDQNRILREGQRRLRL